MRQEFFYNNPRSRFLPEGILKTAMQKYFFFSFFFIFFFFFLSERNGQVFQYVINYLLRSWLPKMSNNIFRENNRINVKQIC